MESTSCLSESSDASSSDRPVSKATGLKRVAGLSLFVSKRCRCLDDCSSSDESCIFSREAIDAPRRLYRHDRYTGLQHPNIVTETDTCDTTLLDALVADALLKDTGEYALNFQRVLRLATEIASGMQYVNCAGMMHG